MRLSLGDIDRGDERTSLFGQRRLYGLGIAKLAPAVSVAARLENSAICEERVVKRKNFKPPLGGLGEYGGVGNEALAGSGGDQQGVRGSGGAASREGEAA